MTRICKLCGKKLGYFASNLDLCKECLVKCPKCGKKKGLDERWRSWNPSRNGLCDQCWKAEIKVKGYDPESYPGTWFELLAADEIIGKHVSAIKMPVGDDKDKGKEISDLLGIIAGHTIGIGWASVELSQGVIFLKDYPIEIIRIEEEKKKYERDDVYTAKILFYSPIEQTTLGEKQFVSTSSGVKLGGIGAKWKGIISKKFDRISIASPFLQEDKFLNDKDLMENLQYLLTDVTCESAHGCRWMGPKLNDGFVLQLITRDTPTKKYLEISTRTVRFSGGIREQVDRTREEEYKYWQKAFRTLLCSVTKIAEYAKPSLLSSTVKENRARTSN